ncbi:OpgC domain-containing protein [Variovorax sp. Sphag1AA]|uniref:OpgC domain-containing protein n=1 Tax=Variovorax sp. Sphag1AA TaxID=2587027 RepID=UPI0016138346|nr:OpgC domain-containing protein [Variovorax sp. Sphag1AA]MBB3179471.1 hypothetical protein [Variovorax sp. Sphag1AA]
MRRLWEIDALRGLMLVLMTLTHLPTRLTDPLGQPFGWVSAAEGFVLLSGFTAGLVYSRVARERGVGAMERAFWKRAFKVYLAQAATLLFLFTVITRVGVRIDQPAVKDLVSYYLAHPQRAFWSGLLLLYEPALLDILPMYVLFMLVSPPVLAFGMRHGWAGVMAISAAIWLGAQFGLSEWIYGWTVALTHMELPFHEMGAFNTLAWQLLWCGGLWLGASRSAPDAQPLRLPAAVVTLAAGVALWGLLWRHFGEHGQAPFGADIQRNLWFDKWQLGPLRLLNLLALCVLAVRFGPALARWLPRPAPLEAMGAASLPVFCAHLIAVLLTLALFGDDQLARPWWGDALLLVAVFGWLYGVARLTLWIERRGRDMRNPQGAPR